MSLSERQKKILAFPYSSYDALICDGSVRSGKTSIMSVSFVNWAMENYSNRLFGLCGKTVDSCWKNLVIPLTSMTYIHERYSIKIKRAEKIVEIRNGGVTNYFEIFGGKDEGSAALIQGRTFAGVMLDEVALMPQSFVQQALARCSVEGARMWFSCNPDSPMHWFHVEWIEKAQERNALYLHFTMRDNPSLSEKTLQRYESMYSGVFYERYILGKWVAAEGLIYTLSDGNIVDELPERKSTCEYYISCDYGTLNPFSAGLWCWDGKTATRMREYYYSGREKRENKTDEEYYAEVDKLAEDLPIKAIIVDPSAASFIEVIRRKKKYQVRKAVNDVIPGIATVSRYLQDGTIKIHRSCKDCIREFGLYRWDEDKTEDKPIKEYDHAMDEVRYFTMTILRHKVGKAPYIPIFDRR